MYSLFRREYGQRKWERVSDCAYDKQTAVRVYQSKLLAPYLDPQLYKYQYELRVVPATL